MSLRGLEVMQKMKAFPLNDLPPRESYSFNSEIITFIITYKCELLHVIEEMSIELKIDTIAI